uniref:Fatty acid-binding protein, intestinal (Fragments) n=1 Tax=Rhamdia sapo TaxID=55673 RepID=FABPI_RHASA|nr:RecName: Full=Fatty acid-binding protein, intestinal; AltName: Full=Fatty acid-binding protein 2; AltName: Full=Intestinal-type fatty acid-binding protein; Short=I-FABP [Rhamdia sapo]
YQLESQEGFVPFSVSEIEQRVTVTTGSKTVVTL